MQHNLHRCREMVIEDGEKPHRVVVEGTTLSDCTE